MKSSDTKNNGALASYVNIIKAPAIQVLLMGTGFLLMMLFVYMGVMTSFDNTLFTTLSALGDVHGWKNDVLRDVTALGSNTVLIFVAAAVAGALALAGEKKKSLTFILAVAAGIAMTFLLKAGIDRPRPSLTMQHVDVYTQSFPSAHATLSTLVYFYIAHLLTHFTQNTSVRAWIYFTAAFLVFCIGLSRVLLGVHWPSDIIAGWFAGGSMASFCFYVIKWKRKLRIKKEG
ncbi:phosphatase PAP2 family protein [Alteromonas mediterranea]|uniref:phosphatase PAP2 family protein n=1 Tax=Alteromonas mediterranea TaxID=314275 RepID=UPI0011324FEA|nr:phosphatase PAP2 family protein [Alteromonas mediterranea]QDG33748.1 phosphatase PAP2 family protein [Alteromonas mediterranea]